MSRPPTTSGLPPSNIHLLPSHPISPIVTHSEAPHSGAQIKFTVGRIDAGLALLLTPDHYLVEFPAILLPDGIGVGAVLSMGVERDEEAEIKR
jgi:hypothetical protein